MESVFLKARWHNLIMANYEVDPKLLESYLPFNTELDFWQDKCYVSLVGFKFSDTKVAGCKIPFHINFEEVNLRFYVKSKDGNSWKRGVVFIKEIVPRHAITWVANALYKEKYVTLPMKHSWVDSKDSKEVEYSWKLQNSWNSIKVRTKPLLEKIKEGSEEEFITEHYWGYTKINPYLTSEYQVEHPRWNVYKVLDYTISCNFAMLYGKDLEEAMKKPSSVFMADGSEIIVRKGIRL